MHTAPPTIRDVAKAAGVAVGTVSRVLNGVPNIRPAHRDRVRKAVAQLGYQPRPPGAPRGRRRRPPVRRRTFQIAFLSPGAFGSLAHVPVYLDVLHGVQAAAEEQGLTVLLGSDRPETRRAGGGLRARVDGGIFLHMDLRQALGLTRGRPCVQVMGRLLDPAMVCDQVTYDNTSIGRLAAGLLLRRGHRKCGFLGDAANPLFAERGAGFRLAIEQAGATTILLDAHGIMSIHDGMNVPDMTRLAFLVNGVLTARPAVTGLFVESDHWLGPLYSLLYQRGVQPGRDLDLVGCNREWPLLSALHPRPASIDLQAEEIGRRAVLQLVARMDDATLPPLHLALPPAMVPGEGGAP